METGPRAPGMIACVSLLSSQLCPGERSLRMIGQPAAGLQPPDIFPHEKTKKKLIKTDFFYN